MLQGSLRESGIEGLADRDSKETKHGVSQEFDFHMYRHALTEKRILDLYIF